MSTRDWFKFIALSLIWGTSYLWIKIAVTEVGPFILVVFRTLFAALTILAFLLYRRIKMPAILNMEKEDSKIGRGDGM